MVNDVGGCGQPYEWVCGQPCGGCVGYRIGGCVETMWVGRWLCGQLCVCGCVRYCRGLTLKNTSFTYQHTQYAFLSLCLLQP